MCGRADQRGKNITAAQITMNKDNDRHTHNFHVENKKERNRKQTNKEYSQINTISLYFQTDTACGLVSEFLEFKICVEHCFPAE